MNSPLAVKAEHLIKGRARDMVSMETPTAWARQVKDAASQAIYVDGC